MPKRFTLNGDPDEDQIQQSIVDLLKWVLPDEVAWTHVAHGGYQLTKAASARLYRLGLTKGWPDILLCYGGRKMLWMEVKAPRGALSRAQKDRHAQLQALGHVVVVVRSADDALHAMWNYQVPFKRARLAEGFLGKTQAVAGGKEAAAQGTTEGQAQRSAKVVGPSLTYPPRP